MTWSDFTWKLALKIDFTLREKETMQDPPPSLTALFLNQGTILFMVFILHIQRVIQSKTKLGKHWKSHLNCFLSGINSKSNGGGGGVYGREVSDSTLAHGEDNVISKIKK